MTVLLTNTNFTHCNHKQIVICFLLLLNWGRNKIFQFTQIFHTAPQWLKQNIKQDFIWKRHLKSSPKGSQWMSGVTNLKQIDRVVSLSTYTTEVKIDLYVFSHPYSREMRLYRRNHYSYVHSYLRLAKLLPRRPLGCNCMSRAAV